MEHCPILFCLKSVPLNQSKRLTYQQRRQQRNVFGQTLQPYSFNPLTGWFRDGYAHTDRHDRGTHTVCATMTQSVSSTGRAKPQLKRRTDNGR